MNEYRKRKLLKATKYKIKRIHSESGFFIKNIWKVIIFGIGFSFWTPFYRGDHEKSILEKEEYTYIELVLFSASVYVCFCLLGHFVWGIQDKRSLKKLIKKKEILEIELKNNKKSASN